MDLGEFYEKYKQYYYWKLSRNISGMGLIFPAEDIIHDVVVTMIADEKHRTKFERLPETEAKAYFMSCLKHRLVDIIRREKRRREYLETLERYEKKLETENSNTEMIVVEELDFGNNIAGTLKLLRPEERELLHLAFIQKMPYREIAGRSQLRESAIAMRVMRLRRKLLKICLERGILCEKIKFGSCQPEKHVLS
ncbi:RNA polymerase sigma factor [Lacrimispora indolis]|uniref:RNA polymerase sigma factor n=1 Tax=Lacrimispora indolis TaxID=69825 RepID=UPI003566E306